MKVKKRLLPVLILLLFSGQLVLAQQNCDKSKEQVQLQMKAGQIDKDDCAPSDVLIPFNKMNTQQKLDHLESQLEQGQINPQNYTYEKARLESILKSKDDK